MSLHFFRNRIDRYAELIREGKYSLASVEMKQYLEQGLQEQSDVAQLMLRVQSFDTAIQQTIKDIESGDQADATRQLDQLRQLLREIKLYAALVAKEEERLE